MSLLARTARAASALVDLALRLWLAQPFFVSGVLKASDWSRALYLAEHEYPVAWLDPWAAALLGVSIELAGSVLLAVGLGTRGAALALAALTFVVQTQYVMLDINVVQIVLLAGYVLTGAGPISLDRNIGPGLRESALPGARAIATAFDALRRCAGAPYPAAVALAAFAPGAPAALWLGALALAGSQAFHGSLLDRALALLGRRRALTPSHARVVIVGAGFGGLACANRLADVPVDITLVDRRNHHLFQPLLYQVATTALAPGDIASPVRELFRERERVRVMLGEVTGVDVAHREVVLGAHRLPYDYLVLATGATHSYFGRDEWSAHAPGLKRVEDALAVRRRLLLAFERAEATADADEREAALTFVIVGGGPTGVELAGAIAELARLGMDKDFRSFDPASARVVLIEAAPRVLASFPEPLSAEARAALERLGVEVRVASRVERIDADGVVVAGERIRARTVLWAAGVVASPAAQWLGVPADRAGRVVVDAHLAVAGHERVFAIGDTALSTAWEGRPVPGLAPAAKQAGRHAAAVIRADVLGRRQPRPFRYRHLGSLATIGRKAAVVDLGFVRLRGAPAWWLWGAIHVGLLTGTRNRASVVVDWIWSYLTFRSGTRLITGDEPRARDAAERLAA
jgi:NADH dehydrogenase/putative oxidoreductase